MKEELSNELQTEILKDIGEISNLPVSLQKRLKWITEVTAKRLGIDSCSICLVEKGGELVVLKASTGFNRASINNVEMKMGEGVSGWCALHKQPVNLEDAFQDKRFLFFPATGEDRYVSLYAHPIIFHKECIGVFLINSKKRRKFTQNEINIVNTISHFVSGIIQNTQLFETQERALLSRTILFNFSQAIIGEKSEENIYKQMITAISALTHAEYIGFWVKDARGNFILSNSDKEERSFFQEKISLKMLKGLDPDFTLKANLKSRGQVLDAILQCFLNDKNATNAALMPLFVGKKTAGIILIANTRNKNRDHYIGENDLQRVMTLLNITSVGLRNISLYLNLNDKNLELREKEFALVESEKNSALGELSLELAHEIKNPLLAIGGFAKRLDDKLNNNQGLKKYSEIIIGEAARLELLVKTTLSFIKEQTVKPKRFDLSKVLLERIEHYQKLYPTDKFVFSVKIEKNLTLFGDENKMIQVLNNLFDNSIEMCVEKEGCKIRIDAYKQKSDKKVVVIVHDNCGGAEPEFLTKLIKPYFTTKKHGTGLGLFIVNKVVSAHRGTVSFRNEGDGLKVALTFKTARE